MNPPVLRATDVCRCCTGARHVKGRARRNAVPVADWKRAKSAL